MHIRVIHPVTDPADLAAIQQVAEAAFLPAVRHVPEIGGSRLAMGADDLYDSLGIVLAAFPDEQATTALGYAVVRVEMNANVELAYGDMWVVPQARRQGVGSALHAEALRVAAEYHRTHLLWQAPSSTSLEHFAKRHEGRQVERAIRSVLDLSAVDRARFAALAEPSPANAAYTLVRWVDHCPADLIDSYCRGLSAMQDAPLGDSSYQITAFTPEKLAAYQDGSVKFGVRRHVLVALDGDGEVAGFNSFASCPDEPQLLDIWDTGVVRAHRGHGLGLRIKAEGTLWALAQYPAAKWLSTFNNADNEPMLRVNRELGYQASEDWHGFEFAVPGSSSQASSQASAQVSEGE